MLEQMLESFLGTDHGRNAQQTLQQQGVPQSRIQQILSEALAAHSHGATPQASSGLLGSVFPFVSRFVQEHLGGSPQQNGAQQANNPAAQAKFDANVAGKGVMRGTTPEGQQKLDANRQAKGIGAQPFGKPDFYPQKQAVEYGNQKQNVGKGFPQK